MSVALSVPTEARLRHFRADPSIAEELLEPQELMKLEMFLGELSEIDAESLPAKVETIDQNGQVGVIAGRAHKAWKELEDLRKERVRVPQAEVNSVNDLFRPILAKLEDYKKRAQRLGADFDAAEERRVREVEAAKRRAQEEAARALEEANRKAEAAKSAKARQAAQAEAEQAAASFDAALEAPVRPAIHGAKTEHGTTSSRKVWIPELVDPARLPRHFLLPNNSAIGAAVKALQAGGRTPTPEEVQQYAAWGIHLREDRASATRGR